ncbi:hypothetical protein FQR65_LT12149 [Abscondita terminalis]|nr:hypothetical protein FQR65_LT12149 [Abscondita terminalis]
MKLLLILLTLIFVVNAKVALPDDLMKEWKKVASRYEEECVEESGTDPIVAKTIFKNKRLLNEEQLGCFIECLNRKYGMLTPDGVFHMDVWLSTIKHLTPEVAVTCIKEHENVTNLCKRSYRLALCVAKANYVKAFA